MNINEENDIIRHEHGEHDHSGHKHLEHDHPEHSHTGHQHAHKDGCTCGECRQTDNENPAVTCHIQDGACVVSARYHTSEDPEMLGKRLTELLEELAAGINALEGIIGHIKASLDIHQTEMYSVTDKTAAKKASQIPDITLCLAAIVFMIPEEKLVSLVKEMFRKLAGA